MWSLAVFLGFLFLVYLISAAAFMGLGVAVLLQWPKPRILCFAQPFSDAPKDLACFALNRVHFAYTVAWVALVVVLSVRLRIALMAICCAMAAVHLVMAAVLRQKVLSSPLFVEYPRSAGDHEAVAVGVPVNLPAAMALPQAGSWPSVQSAHSVPTPAHPSHGTVAVPAYPVHSSYAVVPTLSTTNPAAGVPARPQPLGAQPLNAHGGHC